MLCTTFFQHFEKLIMMISIEKLIGFFIMLGVFVYMFYISKKYKKDLWDAVKGDNNKLEVPELIVVISMILYPVIVLSDVFLGLHASEGIFWSLDSIIFFALTGRVLLNRFNNSKNEENKVGENE
jgi:cation transport ATPase